MAPRPRAWSRNSAPAATRSPPASTRSRSSVAATPRDSPTPRAPGSHTALGHRSDSVSTIARLAVFSVPHGRNEGSTKMKTSEIQGVDAQHVLQTYKRMPVALVRGEGARLYDAEGREYIDFLSGIGVAVLGHANPGLADVLADQAKTLVHTSNLFHHPLQGQLAAKLA